MKANMIRHEKTVDTGSRVRYVSEEDCELFRKVVRGYVLDEADPEQVVSVPDQQSKEITDLERKSRDVPPIAKSRRPQFVWCAATEQHKG